MAAYEDLTYAHINLKDYALDDNDLERNCPLDYGRHNATLKQHDLGALDLLPLELLQDTLLSLDFQTLAALRRVNARAMEVVDSVPAYRTILRQCPNIVRGLYSIHYGAHVSLNQLWSTLGKTKCVACDDFGSYVYLITCQRVCFRCFRDDPRLYPLQSAKACRQYGIKKDSLQQIPYIRSAPGIYTSSKKARKASMILLDRDMVLQRSVEVHGSLERMWDFVRQKQDSLDSRYRERSRLREVGQAGTTLRRPSPAQPTDGSVNDPRRYMAVVQAPHIDLQTGTIQAGRHCSGCARTYRDKVFRRKYTVETFVEHLREYGDIVDGVHKLKSNRS